jgi:hypothetical protein
VWVTGNVGLYHGNPMCSAYFGFFQRITLLRKFTLSKSDLEIEQVTVDGKITIDN